MNPAGPPPTTHDASAQPAFKPEPFGRYYLIDRLAVGGMAEIFRAKAFGEGGFENQLVIKRILTHLSNDEAFVRMFMDEAKVSALLKHPNIVGIYDFGRMRDNYFIAMEHVDGKDVKLLLRKLAERRKTLDVQYAAYMAMEAAKGLDYAHRKTTPQGQPLDIVHRDVSPSNILVGYQGEVKVADFGIVKASNVAGTTGAGTLKGKFEYMSPEQAAGRDLDRRSDIFALGIILWEMLTCRRLFKTDSDVRTLELIKNGDVDPPSTRNPQVPARLDDIVLRALARDPADRYQDARELHADLREFLYPAAPDLLQQSLAHFMGEVFADELKGERERMEVGTRIAHAMHEAAASEELEPDWDEGDGARGTGTGTAAPAAAAPAAGSNGMRTAGVAAGVVIALVVAGGVVLRPEAPQVVEKVVEREVLVSATTGAIKVRVTPAARATLDGKPVGEGASQEIVIPNLAPGSHGLRLEAEGYAPHEQLVAVEAGMTEGLPPVALRSTEEPKPVKAASGAPPVQAPAGPPKQQQAAPAAATASFKFTSKPSGADVFIEGRLVGRTPFDWEGPAGESKSAEYRLSGYEAWSFKLGATGGTYDKALVERAKATGKITVNVSGTWAEVYVDGKKMKNTPVTLTLDAGEHTVRVKNDAVGLDSTKQVTVKAGDTPQPVSFSAE